MYTTLTFHHVTGIPVTPHHVTCCIYGLGTFLGNPRVRCRVGTSENPRVGVETEVMAFVRSKSHVECVPEIQETVQDALISINTHDLIYSYCVSRLVSKQTYRLI